MTLSTISIWAIMFAWFVAISDGQILWRDKTTGASEATILNNKALMKSYKNRFPTLTTLVTLLAMLAGSEAMAECNPDITITKPNSIYTNHGNGTVTDNDTGLMWMQCSVGLSGETCTTGFANGMNWKQALESAQSANSANGGTGAYGYTDWRLPNRKELGSLTETACFAPAINTTLFPNTVSDGYWSASPGNYFINTAWSVLFDVGSESDELKDSSFYVRLVRDSQ